MPKYIISCLFENIVKADDADEAKQFLIDDEMTKDENTAICLANMSEW